MTEYKYCEMCDTTNTAKRRKDNIYVCDKCNKKYPVPKKEMRKSETSDKVGK